MSKHYDTFKAHLQTNVLFSKGILLNVFNCNNITLIVLESYSKEQDGQIEIRCLGRGE